MTDDANCEPCDGHGPDVPVVPRALPPPPGVTAPPTPHPPPQGQRTPRLTVVGQTYYQAPDDDPVLVEEGWGRDLVSEEGVYRRRVKVGEQWVELDYGWADHPSLLVIQNLGAPPRQSVPTEEERAADASLVLHVAFADPTGPDVVIRPKESCRFTPWGGRTIYLRCPAGVTRVVYTVFPQ